jgi:hypothetical protein
LNKRDLVKNSEKEILKELEKQTSSIILKTRKSYQLHDFEKTKMFFERLMALEDLANKELDQVK